MRLLRHLFQSLDGVTLYLSVVAYCLANERRQQMVVSFSDHEVIPLFISRRRLFDFLLLPTLSFFSSETVFLFSLVERHRNSVKNNQTPNTHSQSMVRSSNKKNADFQVSGKCGSVRESQSSKPVSNMTCCTCSPSIIFLIQPNFFFPKRNFSKIFSVYIQ